MPDFAARRTMMVDTQVRPSDVTKLPIIEAMLTIPRERFVPGSLTEAAYVGENLQLGGGRVLLEPRTLAKMLDMLDIRLDDMVLDVAAATGYSSAVIARMAEAVVAVEPVAALADDAESALDAESISNVILERSAANEGAAAHGPYDAIIVQGGVEVFPEALAGQLKDGGRAAVMFLEGNLGVVRLGIKTKGTIHWRDMFNANAPLLDGFAATREFAL
ncbi:protein-L-isoaspartate O-methyltransferase family protein [Pararhodobacter oceanensis]|uniref:Protein-L-isoaspartate O-methyltransferase n=1 Tax=Pararhodobacter oceanensis TaxID=2172121 RepID=A0A2T8HXY4_9RHOB|nr:protein-L-isoaspartate O-methyltransferase [Pararhodobacter oceanensis]PVH30283.1 protein-L-isoaspartate O-methyltransferase [Pararhodobacter oceanensis]